MHHRDRLTNISGMCHGTMLPTDGDRRMQTPRQIYSKIYSPKIIIMLHEHKQYNLIRLLISPKTKVLPAGEGGRTVQSGRLHGRRLRLETATYTKKKLTQTQRNLCFRVNSYRKPKLWGYNNYGKIAAHKRFRETKEQGKKNPTTIHTLESGTAE